MDNVQLLEKEIREAAASALERMGVLDETKISQKAAAALSIFSYEQFEQLVEGVCRKDGELWQRICAFLPEESAGQGFSAQAMIARAQRAMFLPVFRAKLQEAFARLKTRAQIKVTKAA